MTLLRTLPEARIYSVTNPAVTSHVFLAAYAVDQGQPLIVHLDAFGSDADLDRLEQEGLVDDLATMVASLRAVPPDATNLRPALPPASVDHPGPSTSVPAATNPPSAATATIRTVDVSGTACGGIGINDGTLRGDPHDPRVAWLDLGSSGTMDLVFPKGFTARFTPRPGDPRCQRPGPVSRGQRHHRGVRLGGVRPVDRLALIAPLRRLHAESPAAIGDARHLEPGSGSA